MAVLIEANCVVILEASIHKKFKGGMAAFESILPNRAACADGEVLRIGFMMPADLDGFLKILEQYGLQHHCNGEALDFVVVTQFGGFQSKCNWAEFGHVELVQNQRIAACRLVDSQAGVLITIEGWEYVGSLSHTYAFVPDDQQIEKSMRFVRSEGNIDVYLNLLTGKEMYVGRTGQLVGDRNSMN
jgi:hypothetical protein